MTCWARSYDAQGNHLTRTDRASGAVTECEWDYRNRLVKVIEKPSAQGAATQYVDYVYAPFNHLVQKSPDADGAGEGTATNTCFVYETSGDTIHNS